MKMVSTRGVKFKFEKSEKVLCYEPDPTKAKVLYESKVLEVGVTKDKHGRKVAEYLIHFNGWNSSWDRCVTEELILEDTIENRRLQRELAEEAALLKLKDKKKKRLAESSIMGDKNRRNKMKYTSRRRINGVSDAKVYGQQKFLFEHAKRNHNGRASKLSILEKLLRIPDVLKQQLENDFTFVKNTAKLIQLPCEPNVVYILEDYVQNFVVQTLHSMKKSDAHLNCDKKLNLCKEMLDGLRIYFDFTLPSLLLYNSEKKQYEYFSKNFKPKCPLKEKHFRDGIKRPLCDIRSNSFDATLTTDTTETILSVNQDILETSSSSNVCDTQSFRLSAKTDEILTQTALGVGDETDSSSTMSLCANSTTIAPNSSLAESTHIHSSLPLPCHFCRDSLNWDLLPSYVYESVPPVPSVIYGAQHLLRLFVKLPELLSKSSMPKKQIKILGKHLQKFLRYLADNQDELFQLSVYVDYHEDFASMDLAFAR